MQLWVNVGVVLVFVSNATELWRRARWEWQTMTWIPFPYKQVDKMAVEWIIFAFHRYSFDIILVLYLFMARLYGMFVRCPLYGAARDEHRADVEYILAGHKIDSLRLQEILFLPYKMQRSLQFRIYRSVVEFYRTWNEAITWKLSADWLNFTMQHGLKRVPGTQNGTINPRESR